MEFPVTHNGQKFNVVKSDTTYGVLNVFFRAEVYTEDADHIIDERLGSIFLDNEDYVSAQTRYGFPSPTLNSLDEAVAYIVDNYRPCKHDYDAEQVSGNVWHCNDCGVRFTREA